MFGYYLSRLAALILSVVLVVGSPAIAASADQGSADCAAEQATISSIQQQIAAHNARWRVYEVPREAAQLAAYNAEADQLNAAQASADSALQACLQRALTRDKALEELADRRPNSPVLKTEPPAGTRQKIEEAQKNIPPGWQAPPRVPGKPWRVDPNSPVRPIYDALREKNPGSIGDVTLRGVPRPKIGDPDPAYPGRTIPRAPGSRDPNVSPDHIVPLAEIVQMPGFTRLNPEYMYAVTRAPLNLQWMSRTANRSKSSRIVAEMTKADPAWRASQTALQNQVRTQLQDIINRLLASQG
jgi:hypothetical protein